ncbi:DMT family transporter [Ornithinimicrobium sp. Y1847]|uniref:DMT family transporter n=1 Tax=unclassified Ornithinimicrobium TaxID=2615080 RepID=UPI003B67C26C
MRRPRSSSPDTTARGPGLRTRANLLLALTAFIWGMGFVAQRLGADHMGAMSFNAVRFAIGAVSLLPLIWWFSRRRRRQAALAAYPEPPVGEIPRPPAHPSRSAWLPGLVVGLVLFTAAGLQQVGIADTTAGKAAFITGLYMLMVPLLGTLIGQRIAPAVWVGIALALPGLWLLSVTGRFTIATGDVLVLVGAFFWAVHILVIDHYIRTVDALQLSAVQFASCAVLSTGAALLFESDPFGGMGPALAAILYSGVVAVGVAYTLQVVAQRHAKPSHAALLLSLEAVFGALGGVLILGETMTARMVLGASLMMAGILISLRGSHDEPAAPAPDPDRRGASHPAA